MERSQRNVVPSASISAGKCIDPSLNAQDDSGKIRTNPPARPSNKQLPPAVVLRTCRPLRSEGLPTKDSCNPPCPHGNRAPHVYLVPTPTGTQQTLAQRCPASASAIHLSQTQLPRCHPEEAQAIAKRRPANEGSMQISLPSLGLVRRAKEWTPPPQRKRKSTAMVSWYDGIKTEVLTLAEKHPYAPGPGGIAAAIADTTHNPLSS
jgi:hypothetical protein